MNTGSIGVFEPLGMDFQQYYSLGRSLGLSRATINMCRNWTMKCTGCGRLFSPRNKNRKIETRCLGCRILWRTESERYRKQQSMGIKTPRKPFQLYKTGSYIA